MMKRRTSGEAGAREERVTHCDPVLHNVFFNGINCSK